MTPGRAPTRWGASLTPEDLGAAGLARLARCAEAAGYTDVWNAESGGTEGVVTAAGAAMATERVRIGTGVLNTYSRTPFTLAMAASSLQELSGGRFCLGIGSSSQNIIERWHGLPFDLPRQRVRETALVVRALLDGERVSFDGRTVSIAKARLAPVDARIPLWIGALGPKMLELAGELGDGVVLTFVGPTGTRHLVEEVLASARRHGRPDPEVGHRVLVPFPGDSPAALDGARDLFCTYTRVGVYRAMFDRLGHADAASRISARLDARDRHGARRLVTDELLHEFFVVGTPEEQYRRLLDYTEAGVSLPILSFHLAAGSLAERTELAEAAVTWFGQRWRPDVGDHQAPDPATEGVLR